VKSKNAEFDEVHLVHADNRGSRSDLSRKQRGTKKISRDDSEKNCEMCGRAIDDGEEKLTLRDGKTVVCGDCYRLITFQRFGK